MVGPDESSLALVSQSRNSLVFLADRPAHTLVQRLHFRILSFHQLPYFLTVLSAHVCHLPTPPLNFSCNKQTCV
jgi:hypothetical protein